MNKFEKFIDKWVWSILFSNKSTKKLANNTSWLLFDKIIRIGIGFSTNVYIARALGPAQFGILSYCLAFSTLIIPLSTLSLEAVVVRDLATGKKGNLTLGSVFVLRLISGILCYLVNVTAVFCFHNSDYQIIEIVSILSLSLISQSFDVVDLYYQSVWKSKYTVYTRTTMFVLMNLVKLYLVYNQYSLIWFASVQFLEFGLGTIGLNIIYKLQFQKLVERWVYEVEVAKEYVKLAIPLVSQGILLTVMLKFDQILISKYLGESELGQYSVALRLIEFMGFIPMVLFSSIAPTIAQAKNHSSSLYEEKLSKTYFLFFLLTISEVLPILIFGRWFIENLYGLNYANSGFLFVWMSSRLFFVNVGVVRSIYVTNESLFIFSTINYAFSTILLLGLNIFLLPRFGAIGSIAATFITSFFSFFIFDLFNSKLRYNLFIFWRGITLKFKK